jgi:hypothetical protein
MASCIVRSATTDQLPTDMAIWRGIIAGVIGGVVAAGAMSVVHKGLITISSGTRQPTAAAEQEQDEDATVTVANGIAVALRRPLPADKKPSRAASSTMPSERVSVDSTADLPRSYRASPSR